MNKLNVIWSSGDKEVAQKMVFMYVFNAKTRGWWENINLIVWRPSQKLVVEDEEIYASLKNIMHAGVHVEACIACSEMYGITEKLVDAGIDTISMGMPLTSYIKDGEKIITF